MGGELDGLLLPCNSIPPNKNYRHEYSTHQLSGSVMSLWVKKTLTPAEIGVAIGEAIQRDPSLVEKIVRHHVVEPKATILPPVRSPA